MGSEHSTIPPTNGQFPKPSTTTTYQYKSSTKLRSRKLDSKKQRSSADEDRPGSVSPGPSVCSDDTDLPYISYTVNRPIGGDSPKDKQNTGQKGSGACTTTRNGGTHKTLTKRNSSASGGTATVATRRPKSTLVVVKEAAAPPNLDRDPDIVRLHNIPMFLPIMRATLSLPSARDPEVLERLDPVPLNKFCVRYQAHLGRCANVVATEQNQLSLRIREIDTDLVRIVHVAEERQKKLVRCVEVLTVKTQEISDGLTRCHLLLNGVLESLEMLNDHLDDDCRIEPFIWQTNL